MRVAFYNQMFGLDGRSAISVGLVHWLMLRESDNTQIERKAKIKWTIRTLIKAKADILAVAEVLPGQRDEFKSRLNFLGYKSVFFFSELNGGIYVRQDVLLASRYLLEPKDSYGFPVNNELTGGGGIVHCRQPEHDFDILAVHLARLGNGNHGKQMDFLKNRVYSIKGDVILMGDFNDDKQNVQEAFPGFQVITNGLRTCSIVPLIKLFYFKDIDHILARGYQARWVGKKRGKSDHRLIYADLEKNKNSG